MVEKILHGGAQASPRPDSERDHRDTRRTKDGRKPDTEQRMPGASLRRAIQEGPAESQPSSRTGENPPYGMIGRIEETSASFEARSAPRSYPTRS